MESMMSFKNNGGVGRISLAQPYQGTLVPWVGSQQLYGESFVQFKAGEQSNGDGPLTGVSGQVHHDVDRRMKSGPAIEEAGSGGDDSSKFALIPEYDTGKEQNNREHTTAVSLQAPPDYQGCFELGFGQSIVCSSYPYLSQCYGLFATYGAQAMSYLHESRHLHAMRRARGCGGRFLNTKKVANSQNANTVGKPNNRKPHALPARSPSSEILQSYSGKLNSASCGSSISGSEVTSMYSRGGTDHFQFSEHLPPSLCHTLSGMIVEDNSTVFSSKWGTAADSCSDFLKV